MKVELQKQLLQGYDAMRSVQFTHEDSAETIAPDYCPDIARITVVKHRLFVQSCTAVQDGVSVNGEVRIDLIYIPQDSSGVRHMSYTLPFHQTVEQKGVGADAWAIAEGRVLTAEGKILNPRKVFTRIRIEFQLRIWQAKQLPLTIGISEGEGVQLRRESARTMLYRTPMQKSFSLENDLPLSGTRDEVEELLHSCARAEINEKRVLNGKVLLKGTLYWQWLYRSASRRLCRSTAEVPFSQILAAEGVHEGSFLAHNHIWVTQEECRLSAAEEGGRTVHAKAELTVFGMAAEEVELQFVNDLYSTKQPLQVQTADFSLTQPSRSNLWRQAVRETIEPGVAVDTVVAAEVLCGEVAGAGQELSARVRLELLYLDENGVPLSAERQLEVRTTAECDTAGSRISACVGSDDVLFHVSDGKVELRFTLEFRMESLQSSHHRCVSTVESCEEERRERPSLLLRRIRSGETAWDLAKQNRITMEELLDANGLSDTEALPRERLLLIPSGR